MDELENGLCLGVSVAGIQESNLKLTQKRVQLCQLPANGRRSIILVINFKKVTIITTLFEATINCIQNFSRISCPPCLSDDLGRLL
jgi:hypothetical protein